MNSLEDLLDQLIWLCTVCSTKPVDPFYSEGTHPALLIKQARSSVLLKVSNDRDSERNSARWAREDLEKKIKALEKAAQKTKEEA